jgi:putative thioredoxin
MGLNLDEQKAVERFRKQVVDPSQDKLVIVDFWAEWCGPCKALTPLLEKVCSEYADKGVVLAKINVDEEQFIAAQFQVKSIPTVYAIFQGQPVADLTPARTESQLKGALDQILEQLPIKGGAPREGLVGQDGGEGQSAPDLDQLVTMGEQVLADGDAERAASIFGQLAQMAPDKPEIAAGLIRALIAAGREEEAREVHSGLAPELQDDPLVKQAETGLELAGSGVDEAELQALRAAAAERPADMEAQMAFAEAAFAAGERDEAAETLLHAIEADPQWNEGAARAKLIQFFEATGLEDPWVAEKRRKLSLILFG